MFWVRMYIWLIEIKENQKLAIQIRILSVAYLHFSSKGSIISAIVYKGNNKITEHRAIFQRESENS